MTVFFICPDIAEPCGGVRTIYRHVDILNRNGISAYVAHLKSGFRCTWFKHRTRIAYCSPTFSRQLEGHSSYRSKNFLTLRNSQRRTHLTDSDFLVFPEIYGTRIQDVKTSSRKIILNQNAFYSFQNESREVKNIESIYADNQIYGVVATSRFTQLIVQKICSTLPVHLVPYSIDSSLFFFPKQKFPQICYLPRKKGDHALLVLQLLEQGGLLRDVKVVAIDGMSESQAAKTMRDSSIFLSFSDSEGFGLPAAEAMACGCTVIGYHGMGGLEFFKSEFSFPVESGHVLEFSRTAENVLKELNSGNKILARRGRQASTFISNNYSKAKEETALMRTWNTIIKA